MIFSAAINLILVIYDNLLNNLFHLCFQTDMLRGGKRMAPKSKDYVHCKLCPACENSSGTQNCLEVSELRSKCKAAVRQCDLVRHNKNNHDGADIKYHG